MAGTAVVAMSLEQLESVLRYAGVIAESATVVNAHCEFNPRTVSIMVSAPELNEVAQWCESPVYRKPER